MIGGTITGAGETTKIRMDTGLEIEMNNLVPLEIGKEVVIAIRPEEFIVVPEEQGMRGKVKLKQFLGKAIKYEIIFDNGAEVEVSTDTNTAERIYEAGETIYINVNTKRINAFDKEKNTTLIEGVHSNVQEG